MKFITLLLALPAFAASGQILTWQPYFTTVEDTITVIYDAAQGNRGLVGATEVYAHTGVITEKSSGPSDWKYVKTNWGQNTPATRLTALGGDKWRIRFHIRSYYGIPAGERVRQLAFVFRNGDAGRQGKTADGGDIFLPIYEAGLNIAFLTPTQSPIFSAVGEELLIRVAAKEAQTIELDLDGERLAQSTDDTLRYFLRAEAVGKHTLTAVARSGDDVKTASFSLIVRQNQIADLPNGARDGITYLPDAVRLVLHAPHKSFVYVIGDFSDWQADPRYLMNRTPDGERYWLELQGLQAGKEHVLQYWVDGALKIADPYAEKVLDPDNDPYISRKTYPNLIPYPKGKTTEIAAVLFPGKPPFEWQANNFKRPPKEQLVIYELLVRDFVPEHSFAALLDRLDYLENLGVNAIELMPINEFEGNSSWGYNPSFYFAVDKYYGPADDLKRFIDAAHGRGMAVILDVVLNHSYGQSPMVRLYREQPALNPWFNRTSPNPVYSWGYDFNHESPATQAFVDRVLEHWLTEYRVDGFRFDFSKGFTNTPGDGWAYDARRIALLKRMAERARAVDPDVYLILEHFTDNREEKELAAAGLMIWGNMNYAFNEAAMGWHENGKSDLSWGLHTRRGWEAPHLVAYMESHDEERLMVKNLLYGNRSGSYNVKNLPTALERVEAAAAFLLMMPGPKMIWQFGDLGYDVSIDFNGRTGEKPIRWNYFDVPERRALYDAYAALIRLKKQPWLASPSVKSSLAASFKWLQLAHDSLNVALAANFDVTALQKSMALPKAGKWYDYMTGDSLTIGAVDTVFTFAPGQYRLLLDRRIFRTGPTAVEDGDDLPQQAILAGNYPNPFNAETVIRYNLPAASAVRITLFDARGRRVRTLHDGATPAGWHQLIWDGRDESGAFAASGLYFYRIEAGKLQTVGKMTLLK